MIVVDRTTRRLWAVPSWICDEFLAFDMVGQAENTHPTVSLAHTTTP